MSWQVEVHRGDAGAFHARRVPDVVPPSLWWFDVTSSALVLGSSQDIDQIDLAACERRGIDVVRRRSGGGAVLLQPGDALWVDVVLPVSDPRWTDDVGRSAWWLGEAWRSTLIELGVTDTSVHHGPLVRTPWSDRICFAGVGGGEVLSGGRKVVGISQRRTRSAARFQCALYRTWRADAHPPLFRPPGPDVADLGNLVRAVDIQPHTLMAAFERHLG